MRSRLQLDVCNLSLGRRHLVNAWEVKAGILTFSGWRLCRYTRSCVRRSLLIGAPRKTTDKLQRVLNSAARIVSKTRTFDRGLTHFRLSQLHWLDVVDRVRFRVCVQLFTLQMSAQDGSWIPVYLLPTRLRHLWPSPPAIGWPWSSRLPTCETCFVRRTFICIRRPFEFELTSCLP